MVYLFCGQDSFAKDIKLKQIKEKFLKPDTEDFNLDILYARELNLISLQEKLLCLPLGARKRIIVIKDAQALKENIREFLLKYAKTPQPSIELILDLDRLNPKDVFIKQIGRYAQTLRFQESRPIDTFALSRYIDSRKADYALRALNQLLREGEKPERILGGLRYSWQNSFSEPFKLKKRLKLLLNCDIDIKTGRLRPDFALEKLVVGLCCLDKF